MAKSVSEPLGSDGYLNPEWFKALAGEISKVGAKEGLKPTEVIFTAKAVPKWDKVKAKQGGEAFTRKRAQPIKTKKRPPAPGARVKMVVLLALFKGIEDEEYGFTKQIKIARKALEQHNKQAERFVEAYKKAATKVRERSAKDFEKNIKALEDMLIDDAGLDADDIAIGQSMMGKTVIVRLPNGGYVSVGKSDEAKFLAAQESGDEDEDEKPAKKSKKDKGEKASKKSSKKSRDEDDAPKKKKKKKSRD